MTSPRLMGWLAGRSTPTADRGQMARAAAYLYITGGLVALLTVNIPGDAGAKRVGVMVVAGVAIATALFLLLVGGRLPRFVFHVLTVCGTGMIGAVVYLGGSLGDAYALFFVWVALYAFYYFTPGQALAHATVISIAAAIDAYFAAVGANMHAAPLGHWFTTVVTCVAAGILVERLVTQVRHFALRDYTTGLPNRVAWDDMFPSALKAAARRGDAAVLVLDLDHMKVFNDDYGVRHGDRLLAAAATGWNDALEAGTFITRVGGDEFALVTAVKSPRDALELADRLRRLTPSGQAACAGVAVWDGKEEPAALFARADAALRAAKLGGRDRAELARLGPGSATVPAAGDSENYAAAVLRALREGVDTVYQPIVGLEAGSTGIFGVEALSRPHGIKEGVEDFFAAAQQMGKTVEIDLICLERAIGNATALASPRLFLNVGLASILEPERLSELLLTSLQRAGREPGWLVLEMTERETVTNLAQVRRAWELLRGHGFGLALDDVGTGRSALTLGGGLAPDFIKIAGELVESEETYHGAAVRSLLLFAHEIGAVVIAEGIERHQTAERMRVAGAQLGQGDHFMPPKAAADLLVAS